MYRYIEYCKPEEDAKMLKLNSYTYEVYTCKTINGLMPLHMVRIRSTIHDAILVFSTSKAAKQYIEKEKEKHAKYNINLVYDTENCIESSFIEQYTKASAGLFSDTYTKTMYINNGSKNRKYNVA